MIHLRSHKAASAAVIAGMALLASSFTLRAADDKEKKDKPAPAAPKAAQPVRTPPAHQAPIQHQDRPANTVNRTATPQTSPTHVNPNTNANPGRPIYPNNTRPTNTNPNTNPNTSQPNNKYNPSNVNTGRPATTYTPSNTNTNRPTYTNNPRAGGYAGRPASGEVTRHPNGSVATYRGTNNSEARFRRDGSVKVVRANDMTIVHGPAGTRRIEVIRSDRTRIVTNSAGRGFVERPFSAGGRNYYQRTYYSRGVPYTRVYRSYYYAGGYYPGYVPVRFYSQVFYGWAYSPWRSPVYYRWGWAGDPWYGYYGGYFTPYPVYSSPSLWLTDYLMAATLQEAYQERQDAGGSFQGGGYNNSYSGQQGLTPDVKQAIADEVHRQVAQENLERQAVAQNSAADPGTLPILAGNPPHVFVVSSNLDVTAGGQECIITQGDVLQLNENPPPDSLLADVQVMASKGQDCPRGSMAAVSLQDLQEMQNHMRATIDQGLGELQAHPGQGGLPKPPSAGLHDTTAAPFVANLPPLDTNAAAELSQQAQQATQAEQEVLAQAQAGPQEPLPPAAGTPASTPTVSLGQTFDEVRAILGAPQQVGDLGAKKIYVYPNMKVIFVNGRVSDVQ